MFCSNCGFEIKDDRAVICPSCGYDIGTIRLPSRKNNSVVPQAAQETNPSVDQKTDNTVSDATSNGPEDKSLKNPELLESVWPDWKLEKKPIGRGSYGVVYRAVREDFGIKMNAAIKVISIPSSDTEWESMRAGGLDEEGTRSYFSNIVHDFVDEIRMLQTLKSARNIVGIEDYKIIERADTFGWDIYIRMELLTPLNSVLQDRTMSEAEVVKLGCDMCEALASCEHKGIIHRDIKPENVFINEFGDYKLGDFGIARKLDHTAVASYKGSPNYMAPEVFKGEEYDSRVDIYSLGVMLYRLLNNNRLPFVDPKKAVLSPGDLEQAWKRRISGESFPKPYNASEKVASAILKACSFERENRYSSAIDLRNALLDGIGANSANLHVNEDLMPANENGRPVCEDLKLANEKQTEKSVAKEQKILKKKDKVITGKTAVKAADEKSKASVASESKIKRLLGRINKKWIIIFVSGLAVVGVIFGIIYSSLNAGIEINDTNFPDAYFREYIKKVFDLNGNGRLSDSEIENVKRIDIHRDNDITTPGITWENQAYDLKGIEFFTSLIYLDCTYNAIESLNVSKNTELRYIVCDDNVNVVGAGPGVSIRYSSHNWQVENLTQD